MMIKKFLFIALLISLFSFTISYAQPEFDGAPPFEFNGEMPRFNGEMPQGMRPQGGRMQRPDGQMPEGMTSPSNSQQNGNQQQVEKPVTNNQNTNQKPQNQPTENPEQNKNAFGGMGNRWGGFNSEPIPEETNFWVEYETAIISIILLALSFLFVIFYKRKRY